MTSPIQIILDHENYQTSREKFGGGPKKDFFANRDQQFREHKARLITQLTAIEESLLASPQTDLGYAKVTLRRSAWAKSHRPLKKLFTPEHAPVVGGEDLGVMLVELRPRPLRQIIKDITEAEEHTDLRFVEARGREVPYPSVLRSETGAIERIEIYEERDRRNFSLRDAVKWLSTPGTGGNYEVELFEMPPPRSAWDALDESRRRLFQSFAGGLTEFGEGLMVQRLPARPGTQPLLSVRTTRTTADLTPRLEPPRRAERHREPPLFDPSEEKHRQLLAFLGKHPLVRKISLPGRIVRTTEHQGRERPSKAQAPIRDTTKTYPKIGVIDGGLGRALSDWVIDRSEILADEDMDPAHGSFIGGLIVLGGELNGKQCCPEPGGAELVDLAVFPHEDGNAFESYYPGGLLQFFDEVETAVEGMRSRHGVRIYNMSLNVQEPVKLDHYGRYARCLDRIADDHDVIVFMPAGNIARQNLRPEWPNDATQALASIATSSEDGLLAPAESARNVAVAAVNPPGHPASIPFAPCRYSRRGPGLRTGIKPDLAHVGGSGSPLPVREHSLFSVAHNGAIINGCGTSYAAPLVAKTAAALDNAIEGDVSRETLIGLLIHHAKLPKAVQAKKLAPVARHLVGFGVPPSAAHILEAEDHEVTLVLASRIRHDQEIAFGFSWPDSLVGPGGKCRGTVRLTLVSTPPLDSRFGAEFVRINLEAALQQQQPDGAWRGKLDPLYRSKSSEALVIEAERIANDLKWSPIKVFAKRMPNGVGESSNWRLTINYLTRAGEKMPERGVSFTAILTISDPDGMQPVFNDMRQSLLARGVQIEDIRTAARITPRV